MSWKKLLNSFLLMEPLDKDSNPFCRNRCEAKEKLAPMLCRESLRSVKWNTQADLLAIAASDLCKNIEVWERDVTKIIGRRPETGMCTQPVREALDNYFKAKRLEMLGK
jgi:hypothetical protein